MPRSRIFDDLINFSINFRSDLGIEVNQQAEKSDKIDQATDSQYWGMANFLNQVWDMSDYQFRHHLNDHSRLEGLTSGPRGDEAHGLLQELDKSLFEVDFYGFLFPLFSLVVVDLSFLFKLVFFPKVKRKPMRELFVGERMSHLLLNECTHGYQVHRGSDHSDLSSTREPANRYSYT